MTATADYATLRDLCAALVGKRVRHVEAGTAPNPQRLAWEPGPIIIGAVGAPSFGTYSMEPYRIEVEGTVTGWQIETHTGGLTATVMIAGYLSPLDPERCEVLSDAPEKPS